MNTIAQSVQISLESASLLNGGTLASPVSLSGVSASLAPQAAQMAQQAELVGYLGSVPSSSTQTYTAAGLLNSFTQAGALQGSGLSASPASASASGASTTVRQNAEMALLQQTLGGNNAASAGGVLPGLNSSWTGVLQNNPELAGVAAQNSVNSRIVDTMA